MTEVMVIYDRRLLFLNLLLLKFCTPLCTPPAPKPFCLVALSQNPKETALERTISFANSGPELNISFGPSRWLEDHSPNRRVHPVLGGPGGLGDVPCSPSNPGGIQEFYPLRKLNY